MLFNLHRGPRPGRYAGDITGKYQSWNSSARMHLGKKSCANLSPDDTIKYRQSESKERKKGARRFLAALPPFTETHTGNIRLTPRSRFDNDYKRTSLVSCRRGEGQRFVRRGKEAA